MGAAVSSTLVYFGLQLACSIQDLLDSKRFICDSNGHYVKPAFSTELPPTGDGNYHERAIYWNVSAIHTPTSGSSSSSDRDALYHIMSRADEQLFRAAVAKGTRPPSPLPDISNSSHLHHSRHYRRRHCRRPRGDRSL